jgi:hypothetical protein
MEIAPVEPGFVLFVQGKTGRIIEEIMGFDLDVRIFGIEILEILDGFLTSAAMRVIKELNRKGIR